MASERKTDNLTRERCVLYEVITRELSDFSDAFVCELIDSLRIIKNTRPEKTGIAAGYRTRIYMKTRSVYRKISVFLKNFIY